MSRHPRCENCGHRYDQSFVAACPQCGRLAGATSYRPETGSVPTPTPEPRRRTTQTTWFWLLLAAIIIGLGLTVMLVVVSQGVTNAEGPGVPLRDVSVGDRIDRVQVGENTPAVVWIVPCGGPHTAEVVLTPEALGASWTPRLEDELDSVCQTAVLAEEGSLDDPTLGSSRFYHGGGAL